MTTESTSELPDRDPIEWVLSTTRSVRKRLDFDRPVAREVVLEALNLAVQAPSGANSQEWQWFVVEDQEKKAAIGEFYRTAWKAYAGEVNPDELTGQKGKVISSAQYLADNVERAPFLVIPLSRTAQPLSELTPEAVAAFYGSILPASWSFLLALRSRGLGAAWTTLHLVYDKEIRELLGIPDDYVQVALFPVAYTVGTDFKPAKRATPIEEITHWDQWGDHE